MEKEGEFPTSDRLTSPGKGELHLWWIPLDAGSSDPAVLSVPEVLRAQRLRNARQRMRFVACRAAVRSILADYVGVEARSVALTVAANGKPELDARVHRGATLAFNVSHDAGVAVLAIGGGGAIGVDLETDGPALERAAMLDSLTPAERTVADRLDGAALAAAFRVAWTRKEACLKAIGTGIAIDPARLEVGLARSNREVAVPSAPSRPAGSRVDVLTLPPDPGGTVSLASVGVPIETVKVFRVGSPA